MINENLNFKDFFEKYGKGVIHLFMQNGDCPFIRVDDLYVAFKEKFATELLLDWMEKFSKLDNKDDAIKDAIRRLKSER